MKSSRLAERSCCPSLTVSEDKASADGKTITATVDGKTVTLPANWSGKNAGAERHAIHGLMRRSKFEHLISRNGPQDSAITATFHAGNFDGHWLSDTDVDVETTLSHDAFDMTVTAKNEATVFCRWVSDGIHTFCLPSGDRAQVRLHLPSQMRAVMNNYDDTFTTGRRLSVKGTPYDLPLTAERRWVRNIWTTATQTLYTVRTRVRFRKSSSRRPGTACG